MFTVKEKKNENEQYKTKGPPSREGPNHPTFPSIKKFKSSCNGHQNCPKINLQNLDLHPFISFTETQYSKSDIMITPDICSLFKVRVQHPLVIHS